MGLIALNLFDKNVNSLENKLVQEFKGLLENTAKTYPCKLTYFAIKEGVVFFSLDSQEAINDFLANLKDVTGQPAQMCDSEESFMNQAKKMLDI